MDKEREALVERLRSLKVLLGTDSPEVRGWAPAVQQQAQRILNSTIAALTAQPQGEPVAHGFEPAVNEYRINKKLADDKKSVDFLIDHLLALADKYSTVNQLYIKEKTRNDTLAATQPGVREGMLRAPWPDFLGQPIYHGDRMSHPDGIEFVAIKLGHDDDSWRAVYGANGGISRLSLQVGDKGQAFVVTRAAEQINAEGRIESLQLPPLNEVMYHAVRGLELDFGSGESLFQGSIDDDTLDLIWESINTALRCAKVSPSPPSANTALRSGRGMRR